MLDKQHFAARNADIETRYQAGTVGLQEFADFYVGTLAGKTAQEWEPLRQEFMAEWIAPRITPAAIALVDKLLEAGDLVVMTTATNRFLTELTAIYFDIEHLIATEPEVQDGRFTGRTTGTLNMREGKVQLLQDWMKERLAPEGLHKHGLQRLHQRPAAARIREASGDGERRRATGRHRGRAGLASAEFTLSKKKWHRAI